MVASTVALPRAAHWRTMNPRFRHANVGLSVNYATIRIRVPIDPARVWTPKQGSGGLVYRGTQYSRVFLGARFVTVGPKGPVKIVRLRRPWTFGVEIGTMRHHNLHHVGARHSLRVSGAIPNLILGHLRKCPISRREMRSVRFRAAKCEVSGFAPRNANDEAMGPSSGERTRLQHHPSAVRSLAGHPWERQEAPSTPMQKLQSAVVG